MNNLKAIIENAFDTRDTFTAQTASAEIRTAVTDAVELLNSGKARVAEKINGDWQVNEWLKKAVLLYFKLHDNKLVEGAETNYYDKVPLKFTDYTAERFAAEGMRVVPPATVRTGSFIGRNVVVMPSYV
ncbi:MAG: 2,3,4,5-tetrahydropyridine-2,6-dicarboxylate N-succinyltransferase, partial [Glaciecola sp.]